MAGEKGTEIRDDKPTNALSTNNLNQHHMAVTLFEHTVYLLRIQLDCSSQLKTELTSTGCNLAQDVNVWIDLNDDGKFDESEIGAPYRWPVTSYMAEGIYDIQIYVPLIDGRYIRNGPHRMRISVVPSNYYRSTCVDYDYNESREYMVTIIPRMKYSSLDATPTSMVPHNVPCSPDVGKVVLVVMAGEHRTQIRDDQSTRTALTSNTRNYQHLAIVLYEDTVYLLRIQFECTGSRSGDSVGNNCNLPHDVAAWIDLNDDGSFSDIENAAPYRWPLTSYIPQGIYDLQIYVPNIDGTKTKTGPHLDIGGPYLTLSDSVCSQTHGKIVLVIMADYRGTHCSPGNLVCSVDHSAISLVSLSGEKNTQLRDETKTCSSTNNYNDRSNLAVTLFENTVYSLHITLSCVQQSSYGNTYSEDPYVFETNCRDARYVGIWIDFNNDGTFDDNTEQIVPNSWYRDDPRMTQSDIGFIIPQLDGRHYVGGQHRMRIVLVQDARNRKGCQNTGYGEVRDYTVQIIETRTY
ncbi:unnamed protein product [Rotaria sp. Silwood1]|nr:unnamed protein product [Rotaria sp. Silwood1]